MTQTPSILLIAQPGYLRDSLQVLLTALSGGRQVVLANSWSRETVSVVNSQPDLALVVLEPGSQGPEEGANVGQIKSAWPQTRLVVLLDTDKQRQAIAFAGADRIWFKGALAAQMLDEIEDLLNE
jgi:DNA-binding NarL/FixJ family response regulator